MSPLPFEVRQVLAPGPVSLKLRHKGAARDAIRFVIDPLQQLLQTVTGVNPENDQARV